MASGGRPTIFYVPGSWPVLVADQVVVLARLDPSGPALGECLAALSAGEPVDGVLARLEPTRWGALIATIGCVVVAVLIVRLDQVWTGVG